MNIYIITAQIEIEVEAIDEFEANALAESEISSDVLSYKRILTDCILEDTE